SAKLSAQNIEFNKTSFPGQKDQLKAALSEIKQGDALYNTGLEGDYLAAIEHYLKAQAFNPNNALLNFKIGKCYLTTFQKSNATPYLETALKLNPYVSPDLHLLLAKAYHIDYKFDKAITEYKAYKQGLLPADLSKFGGDIDKRVTECETGKELVAKPVRVFIDNIGCAVNSPYPDYSPIVNADESMMIFTSRRTGGNSEKKDPTDKGFYEDIYITYNQGGIWSVPTNPGKPLNSEMHDATVGLSPDGQKLFIYKGDNGGDILQCDLDGDKWSKPDRLNKNINTSYHESSASFSYDLKIIYFVSDRPGGYGGSDIYMSKLDAKGRWGEPVNLGSTINTAYNEEGVFMMPDGKTMYFSSRGHKTMGDYDIFKTTFENGKWSEPENIGYPINTPEEDVFFTISGSGKHGYYSSAIAGGCGAQDIYVITFLGVEKPLINNSEDNLLANKTEPISETVIEPTVVIKSSNLTILKGVIMDEKTKDP
ncbi:MAG: peptidoglycan-associated lipoprotein, partial [Odoribacter sp.]|nr:peptidoglycan-associated lipoprotein [Odoribacter sp.]